MWSQLNETPLEGKYEFFGRVRRLGDFEDNVNSIFKEVFPWASGWIRAFSTKIDEWNIQTDIEKQAKEFAIKLVSKAEELKSLSEKVQNGTISERTEVEKALNILLSRRRDIEANSEMKYSNLMLLPSSIRNDLMKRKEGFNTEKAEQYLNEVQEKISPFSDLLLDKGKIKDFLAQENFYEKKNALNVYISFLESLKNKWLLSKIEKKLNTTWKITTDDLEQTFGVYLYENIAQIATLFNYDTIWVVPSRMKEYLNTVSHDGLKMGYFDAQTTYLYITTEEGIFWLKRKTVKDWILQETRRSVTNQEYFNNLDKYFKNFPWYNEVLGFWKEKGEDIKNLLTAESISPTQISSYEAVKNAFGEMLHDVEKKYGCIPWELLEMKDRIENLKAVIYEATPERTDAAARTRKMVRYLETCRLWLDAKSYGKSDKVLIDTLIKQVKSWEKTSFSNVGKERSGKIDSRTIDLLQAFTNDVQTNLAYYFKNSEGKNNEMEQLEKENLWKWWIWNITMEELDKFLEKFNDSDSTKVEFNFGRIESAIAQSFDSSQDSIGFQIMSKEIFSDISKNPSALNRISNLDPAKREKMKKDVALDFRKSWGIYEDFVKQVRNIPLATRQKMVLKENPSFQITEGNSLEKEVIDILINQAAAEGAMVSLTMSTIKDIFSENPDMFSEQSRKFLAHISDNTRWMWELTKTVCKEAALFLATEAITFWVGGFVMGAARGSLWLSRGMRALESRWIAWGIAKTWFFLGKTAFEAGTYTVLSNGVNKWTLSVEGYTESLVGFLWPITGAKIAGKFIPFGKTPSSQTIKEIMGGALGGAAATWSFMFANGQEISFDDLKNMTRQWAIMWAVMIPMMKTGAPIGKWVWEKAAGTKFIQDRIDSRLTRKISELEIKTNGQRDRISQQIEDYKTLLDSLRRDNRFIRLGLKESTINRFNSIISEFKSYDFEAKKSEIEALENEKTWLLGDAKNNARISEISKRIDEIKTEMTNLQLKMEQAKKELGDDIEQVAGNLSDTEMREFINEKLGKVSPLSRLRGEIEWLRKFAKFWLEEKWNNFREMKLESYRNLREMRGTTYIENGFYFNEWKIQTAMGETILTLPESAKVLGIEYYKIGNKQIPCLEIKTPTDTKLVRLNPEARNLPQELFEKVVFNKVEIQWFYDKNNVELLWYKVIENDGSFSYYRLRADNSLRKVTNNDAINEDWYYLHSLASSKGISLEELSTYGINPKEWARLRRQWDREIDEILTPEVVEKMQKKLVEDVKQVEETIKKSPLISAVEKTLLLKTLGKIAGIPLWPLKQMWKHKIITFIWALYFFPDQTIKGAKWGLWELATLFKWVDWKDVFWWVAIWLGANQIIGKWKTIDIENDFVKNSLISLIWLAATLGIKEARELLGNK